MQKHLGSLVAFFLRIFIFHELLENPFYFASNHGSRDFLDLRRSHHLCFSSSLGDNTYTVCLALAAKALAVWRPALAVRAHPESFLLIQRHRFLADDTPNLILDLELAQFLHNSGEDLWRRLNFGNSRGATRWRQTTPTSPSLVWFFPCPQNSLSVLQEATHSPGSVSVCLSCVDGVRHDCSEQGG